uniref:DUF4220 domain-containing protein n=1 Tax=Zea mays TaxID=4577 RepID=A0A804NR22_MAIZE
MTTFSLEDNVLWKRHLLSLTTQVPTAIYIISKQMHGHDWRLVAPMVLVFVSGTAKFGTRHYHITPGFQKRHSSRILSVILWLDYLSADSLAVLVLGRLTLRGGGN